MKPFQTNEDINEEAMIDLNKTLVKSDQLGKTLKFELRPWSSPSKIGLTVMLKLGR